MNYIISYPRSANSFIRTCVEDITKHKTLDCGFKNDNISCNNLSGEVILYKDHDTIRITKDVNKIILVIRNYKDVFMSHIILRKYEKKIEDVNFYDYNEIMNSEKYFPIQYYNLIKFYDGFKDKKLLIYYEDLMKNNFIIKDIIDFLLPNNELIINEETINRSSKKSKDRYKKLDSIKTEKIKNLYAIFTEEENKKLDNSFRKYNTYLYDKYLKRYK